MQRLKDLVVVVDERDQPPLFERWKPGIGELAADEVTDVERSTSDAGIRVLVVQSDELDVALDRAMALS